jgi:hypothetical protein
VPEFRSDGWTVNDGRQNDEQVEARPAHQGAKMSISSILTALNTYLDQGNEEEVARLLLPYADCVDAEVVTSLLRLMRDDQHLDDTMWGFTHMIARANPRVVYETVAQELSTLSRNAPERTQFLLKRLLSASRLQGRGFDSQDFICTLQQVGSADCKRVFNAITSQWPNTPKLI